MDNISRPSATAGLSDEEKSRIKMEEMYRHEVKQSLGHEVPSSTFTGKIISFLNSSLGIWFLSTCLVGGITFAYSRYEQRQQQQAERQQKELEAKQQLMEEARRNVSMAAVLLPYLVSEKESQWRMAFNIAKYLRSHGGLPEELYFSLAAFENDPTDTAKANAATKVLDVVPDIPNKEIVNSTIQKQLPARVYIQIGSEDQRAKAKAIEQTLEASGFVIPGIENVTKAGGRVPSSSQVRYYKDHERDEAATLISILKKAGVEMNDEPIKVKTSGRTRPRHYELWFSPGF